MDKQCATAHHRRRSLNYARRAFVYVLYIYSHLVCHTCVFVGWLVHGALFSSCCVCACSLCRGRREQISAHFLSHADDSCIERAQAAKTRMLCGFPHRSLGGFFHHCWQKAKQCNTALLVGKLRVWIYSHLIHFVCNAAMEKMHYFSHPKYFQAF